MGDWLDVKARIIKEWGTASLHDKYLAIRQNNKEWRNNRSNHDFGDLDQVAPLLEFIEKMGSPVSSMNAMSSLDAERDRLKSANDLLIHDQKKRIGSYAELWELAGRMAVALERIAIVSQFGRDGGPIVSSEHYEGAWLDCTEIAKDTLAAFRAAKGEGERP